MEKTKVDFHITKIFGYIINLNYQIKKNTDIILLKLIIMKL